MKTFFKKILMVQDIFYSLPYLVSLADRAGLISIGLEYHF